MFKYSICHIKIKIASVKKRYLCSDTLITQIDSKYWLPKISATPRIVFKDKDLLVVYKPAGFHTVEKNLEAEPTISMWLKKDFPEVFEIKGRQKFDGGIVHRLDKATSGLILVARSQEILENLILQQSLEKGILKSYLAITSLDSIENFLKKEESWPISAAETPVKWYRLLTKSNNVKKFEFDFHCKFKSFGPNGYRVNISEVNNSINSINSINSTDKNQYSSHFQIVKKLDSKTLIFKIDLKKGFRHQIRSQLAYLGCPIIGDSLYSNKTNYKDRELNYKIGLFAISIEFYHPKSNKRMKIDLEDPEIKELIKE